MRAIVYDHYGPPEVLQLRNLDKPAPAEHEVLIRVHAAGVNPYDWHFTRGIPWFIRPFTGILKPRSPRLGADVAGVVEAVGVGVAALKPGDAVFGICKGSFAEYACGQEAQLAPKPESLTFEEAATMPIAAITALQGLRDCGGVRQGQRVLINGAAGGVGTFAVQIARSLGAHVTAVCSGRNARMVEGLGADRMIDYTRQDFTQSGAQYDVIFDLVGNQPLSALRRALTPDGTNVGCGGGGPEKPSSELLAGMLKQAVLGRFTRQKLVGVLAKVNSADLKVLGEMVESGRLKAVIERTYPLEHAADALRLVETCHVHGKVALSIA